MSTASEQFFENYAAAYQSGDASAVAGNFFIPSVIMSDDRKNVYTSTEAVAEQIQDFMDKLASLGVEQFVPLVCQTMRLSDNIMFSNVKWRYQDGKGNDVLTCFVSYTLQSEQDNLHIIVSVIDDEQRELAKLL